MGEDISRRDFLKITALTLSLNSLSLKAHAAIETLYPYRTWEDLYRNRWSWDKVIRGSHGLANCASACAWDIYVKDGLIWREEQVVQYSQTNQDIPDFNPRGCQKGACYSELMYSERRIKYPLKRAGKRGDGKWKRVSWDEALAEIAQGMIDAIRNHGPETIVLLAGCNGGFGAQTVGQYRFLDLIGGSVSDSWGGHGDLGVGAAMTWGNAHTDGSSDDWFNSDFIVLWNFNPVYTAIPDTHYLYEARYKGTQLISIAPDYNASSIHADLWVNPKVGTDAALALGMAYIIIKENLYKAPYIKEQTDLPMLVREDNGRFLRENDVEPSEKEDVFYFWNLKTNQLVKAPGSMGHEVKSLLLDNLDPALEGSWEVELADRKKVKVRTVFERLKDKLEDYTPEKVSRITGVEKEVIERLAREYAKAKAALIISAWGSNKLYHADLMQRSRILLAALTGNEGKPGGGYRTASMFQLDGFIDLGSPVTRKLRRPSMKPSPETLWFYFHGGLGEVSGKKEYGDTTMERSPDEYVRESMEKGWMPLFPKQGKDPKVLIEMGCSPLRRCRSYQLLLKNLWPKLDLVVDINFRMDYTALNADYVLPAAGYYEKEEIKYSRYVPFLHLSNKISEPLYESKDEWEIFKLLTKKIQQEAKESGFTQFRDEITGITRNLGMLYDDFVEGGKLENVEALTKYIIENSPSTKGSNYEELKKIGFKRFSGEKVGIGNFLTYCIDEIEQRPGQTLVPNLRHVEKKEPWKTLTGRQQFYIDHPWFLEFGEELPVHKDSPNAGGNYPVKLTGGHTRWSIHSIWRDDRYMLRLQRGSPVMYMNDQDAKARGIKDHDYVKVYNDVGSFYIHVKLSPAVRPGQVVVYHAWEPQQYEGQMSHKVCMPTPIKILQLVGDYGHLHYEAGHYQPNQVDRDTVVEVTLH